MLIKKRWKYMWSVSLQDWVGYRSWRSYGVIICPVERPKKELQAILLTPKVEKPEGSTTKKANVRGKYTNWFMPSL
jgi:hypothetical protein